MDKWMELNLPPVAQIWADIHNSRQPRDIFGPTDLAVCGSLLMGPRQKEMKPT